MKKPEPQVPVVPRQLDERELAHVIGGSAAAPGTGHPGPAPTG
jgi:bacteriocin-like protein